MSYTKIFDCFLNHFFSGSDGFTNDENFFGTGITLTTDEHKNPKNLFKYKKLPEILATKNLFNLHYFFVNKFIDIFSITLLYLKSRKSGLSVSIAAASIIAKCKRDALMCEYHKIFPMYGWDKNKGYGTKAHVKALQGHGMSEYHRKTFDWRHEEDMLSFN